jgi:hypothetical protein
VFFGLDTEERTKQCCWSCYTCFSHNGCFNECKNVASIPKILLCAECGFTDSSGKKTLNVLLCATRNHKKPD